VQAHAHDLRVEVDQDERFAGRDAAAFARELAERGPEAVAGDARLHGLLRYAEKLTRAPGAMDAADVEALRALGYDDRAIHDAAQATAYFGYINRVADGLGVDLEPEMREARG